MAKKTLETIGTEASRNDSQDSAIADKQAALVSATNIKTINGASVLGSGDLTVSGSAAWGGITGTLSNQTDLNNALSGKEPTKGADDNFVTDAQLVVIGNTAGVNSGDNAANSQYTTLANTLLAVYPVGAIYTSVVSTSPATLFGGTWSAIAAGRVLIGLNSGDTDFDTAEETGGAKTVTIAQANLPNISTGAGTSHNHTQDSHTHVITELRDATTGGVTTNIAVTADTSSTIGTKVTGGRVAVNQAEAAHTHSLGGSGTALSIVQPYFVVYMWKRTA